MTTTLDNETVVLIAEHVRRLLALMNFPTATVHCHLTQSPTDNSEVIPNLQVSIDAGDAGRLLIGAHGTHLSSLQHIIRCLLHRQITTPVHITVDVNQYRARREQNLSSLAEAMARRAQTTGRTVLLRPMDAADRRTVHSALATHTNVKTESLGDEPNRRVAVKPVFL